MTQQLIALAIILFFITRLFGQRRRQRLAPGEFWFWLAFWILAAILVIGLKWLDRLVAKIGFSGSGIEVLLYLAVTVLFYFIFRLRLRLAKAERDITEMVRQVALINKQK